MKNRIIERNADKTHWIVYNTKEYKKNKITPLRQTWTDLYIIFIAILCLAVIPVAIAGDIIKHYDEDHNITGYTVIDGNRQTHYDSSWNRIGHTISGKTKDTHYDINQNRIGYTEWDNDDTGSHYDKENNRTGYSKKHKDKEVMFDKYRNRKGYKK